MKSLSDAILEENIQAVQQLLRYEDVNQIDEYGFTPLIEAAIVDNITLCKMLLAEGADPNQQDTTGGTALQWGAENNNLALCRLLIEHHANPNAYNFAGQSILVMPMLRKHQQLKQFLIRSGANQYFAKDFINTKLLGHLFELIGIANIVSPAHQFVEVDFEGFFLEVTLGLISDSLSQFVNHFAARKLKHYAPLANYIVNIMQSALELVHFQQYRIDIKKHTHHIHHLLKQDPMLIPVGYEGHAITFIKGQNIWVKCDRREDSRLYDNIMFYHVNNIKALTPELIKKLLYKKQSYEFINQELDQLLALQPLTELKVEAQISGNCSWANVEASIPTLFYLLLLFSNHNKTNQTEYKNIALNYFHRWREWNKIRALHFCIQSFKEGNALQKASKAEILAAILFQRCDVNNVGDREYIELILSALVRSPYEYVLKNYLKIYYYEGVTPEGEKFASLLKKYGYLT